jgi:hypothetical protein
LPRKYTGREYYQYLTGLALKLLKQEIGEEDIIAALLPTLPSTDPPGETRVRCEHPVTKKKPASLVYHPKGQYFFIPPLHKRFSTREWVGARTRFYLAGTG